MFSRGALNASTVNQITLNDGSFVEETTATGAVSMVGTAQHNRRATQSATGTIAVTGLATSLVSFSADSMVKVSGAAAFNRVARADLVGTVRATGTMAARRRAALTGVSGTSLAGRLGLTHRFLRLAANERITILLPDSRRETVARDGRKMNVAPERRLLIVPPEPRAA